MSNILTCAPAPGDGSYASGSVWKDTVLLGNISIPDVIVESAVTVSRSMVTDQVLSGLLGLAYAQPSQVYPAAPTFLDLLTPLLDEIGRASCRERVFSSV